MLGNVLWLKLLRCVLNVQLHNILCTLNKLVADALVVDAALNYNIIEAERVALCTAKSFHLWCVFVLCILSKYG